MLASKIKEIKNGRVVTKDRNLVDINQERRGLEDKYEQALRDGDKGLVKSYSNRLEELRKEAIEAENKRDEERENFGDAIESPDLKSKIIEFFKANPNPNDDAVHAFAEKEGIDPHELETNIYSLLSERLSEEETGDKLTLDPLTEKGKEILSNMKEQYGAEKGEQVFYASKNKGTISGVDSKTGDDWSPEARQKALEARRRNAKGGQRQEPSEKRKRLVKALSDPWNEKKDPDRNTREEHIKGLRSWRSDMEKAREAGNTKLANQILKNIQTQSRKHGIQAHEIYKDSKPIKRISAYSSKDEDDIFKKRQIEIAKKTLRMPDAMVGVIGGMTKEEAKEILKKYGVSESEDEKEPIDPTNPKNIASAKTKAVAGGQAAVTSSGKMKDANGDFNQYLQDVINYMMGKGLSPDTAWMASKYGREEIKTYFDRGASVKEAGDIIFARQTR